VNAKEIDLILLQQREPRPVSANFSDIYLKIVDKFSEATHFRS